MAAHSPVIVSRLDPECETRAAAPEDGYVKEPAGGQHRRSRADAGHPVMLILYNK